MKQIGYIDKRFHHIEGDVAYYALSVEIGRIKRRLLIPRYHSSFGEIETFGLPPQQEWVVLDSIKPFRKNATLKIDGKKVKESIFFNTDRKNKMHYIRLTRTHGKSVETFDWFEDYSTFPLIINEGFFSSERGVYHYRSEKHILSQVKKQKITRPSHKHFFEKTIARVQARPDICVIKNFKARGALPPLFSSMYPLKGHDFSNVVGTCFELGYLRKTGGKLERAHGNWYKLFEIGKKHFVIEEECGPFRVEKIKGVPTKIKDTYTKKLYSYTL